MAKQKLFKERLIKGAKAIAIAAGMLAITAFGACKKPEPDNLRCYDYKDRILRVNEGKGEKPLPFSKLGLDEAKPLDYYCTRSGYLFWLTPKKIHVRRIIFEDGELSTRKVMSLIHTTPDEYKDSRIKVIDGHIGGDPTKSWQDIRIATLTNTGIFQVMTLSLDSIAKDKPNRALINFMNDNDVEPAERWPEKNIAGGVVRVLNKSEFSIIPLGVKGLGSVRNFYYFKVVGNLRTGDSWVGTMKLWAKNPTLKNIYSVTTRYEEASGGHVGNFECETADNKNLVLLQTLTHYKD